MFFDPNWNFQKSILNYMWVQWNQLKKFKKRIIYIWEMGEILGYWQKRWLTWHFTGKVSFFFFFWATVSCLFINYCLLLCLCEILNISFFFWIHVAPKLSSFSTIGSKLPQFRVSSILFRFLNEPKFKPIWTWILLRTML